MIGAKIAVPNLLPWLGRGPSFTGLLDTYSGAAAAYSVRLLDSAYTGAAVRVRESSGGTEADIGFNASGNLDETALLAHCGANDGFVTKWYDQSGNGYDAIQSTAGSQPQIVSSGTVVKENALPAMDFDGATDQLTVSFGTTYAQPTNSFLVHNFTSAPTAFDGVIGSIGAEHRVFMNGALNYTIAAGGFLAYSGYQLAQSLISYNIYSSDPKFYLNGSEQSITSGTSIGSSGLEGIVMGGLTSGSASGNAPIRIQELIIYPSDQSANRTGIEANINGYFSIYP